MDESGLMDAIGFKREVEHLSGEEQIIDSKKRKQYLKSLSREKILKLSKKYLPEDMESCRRIHIGLNIRQLRGLIPCCKKVPRSDLLTKTRTFIERLEKKKAENKEQKAVLFEQRRKLQRRLNELLQEYNAKKSVSMAAIGCKREAECLSVEEQIIDSKKRKQYLKSLSREKILELAKKYLPEDMESCYRIHIGLNIRQLRGLVPCCKKVPILDLLTKTRTFIERLEKEKAENKEQRAVLFKKQRKLQRRLNELLQEGNV